MILIKISLIGMTMLTIPDGGIKNVFAIEGVITPIPVWIALNIVIKGKS